MIAATLNELNSVVIMKTGIDIMFKPTPVCMNMTQSMTFESIRLSARI